MTATKAELQARLDAAMDLLRAVAQVSASPLHTVVDVPQADLIDTASQLRDRLADVRFWTAEFVADPDRHTWCARILREHAAKDPFTYRINNDWAIREAGHAPEDFEGVPDGS
jgi:hypothetical protein